MMGGRGLSWLFRIFGGGVCRSTCLNHISGWTEWEERSIHVMLGRVSVFPAVGRTPAEPDAFGGLE